MWSTHRRTDRPTDKCKAIYPHFFEGGHNKNWNFIRNPLFHERKPTKKAHRLEITRAHVEALNKEYNREVL